MASKAYSQICIGGLNLILRPYKMNDYARCIQSAEAKDPSASMEPAIPVSVAPNLKSFKNRILRYRALAKDGRIYVFGIFERRSFALVGQVDLMILSPEFGWANLGYNVAPTFRQRGYGTECAKLALRCGFYDLKLHRIEASMELNNAASEKVAVNAGLEFEGIRRKFLPYDEGVDVRVYAINVHDFTIKEDRKSNLRSAGRRTSKGVRK